MARRTGPILLVLILLPLGAGAWLMARGLSRDRDAPPPAPEAHGARIVALSPAIAITLRDLGLAPRIVGRHGFDRSLPRSIPVCGDQSGIDYEALIRVDPTHVLLEWGSRPIPARLERLAEERGWEVRTFTLLSLDDIAACVEDLERLFDAPAPELRARLLAAWTARPGRFEAAGRVLLLGAVEPPSVLGPGSFHHQILERVGGTPAVTEGNPFITLDAEDVVRLAPDAIILILPRSPEAAPRLAAPGREELERLIGRLARLDLRAVERGRLALIDDPLAHTPSTAMIDLADEMARLLEGWAR